MLTLSDFLYMLWLISVSSDFDDDGTLDCGDLEKLVNCLTGETEDTRLTPDEMRQLINNVSAGASPLGGLRGPDGWHVWFACTVDSRGVGYWQGWNGEPVRVSARHFTIPWFCQVRILNNLLPTRLPVCAFVFKLTALDVLFFSPVLSRLCCKDLSQAEHHH